LKGKMGLQGKTKGVFGRAAPEGLLYFSLKNGSSSKTFRRAPPEEPEPKLGRSPDPMESNSFCSICFMCNHIS